MRFYDQRHLELLIEGKLGVSFFAHRVFDHLLANAASLVMFFDRFGLNQIYVADHCIGSVHTLLYQYKML